MKYTILIIGCIFFGYIILYWLYSLITSIFPIRVRINSIIRWCIKKLEARISNTKVPDGSIPTLDEDSYWKVLTLWSEGRSHYHTLNGFYLAGCTILLAVIGQVYTSSKNNVLILLSSALFGAIISVQWFIATWRQVTQLQYQAKLLSHAETELKITKLMSAWGEYHTYDDLWKRKTVTKHVSRFAFIVGNNLFGMRMRIMPVLFLSIFICIFFMIY